jgi:hypothetical protein
LGSPSGLNIAKLEALPPVDEYLEKKDKAPVDPAAARSSSQ